MVLTKDNRLLLFEINLWELVDINSEWKQIQLPDDTLRDEKQIAVSTSKNNLKIFCGKMISFSFL